MIGNKKPRKLIGQKNGLNIFSRLKVNTKLKSKSKIKPVSTTRYSQNKKERQLKQKLMDRCKGLCENCHRPPDFRGLSKHEIIFRSKGGNPLDESNVEMLCFRCHNLRHHIKER